MDDKVAQLHRLKAQRSRQRELRDLEERKLLDTLEETNRRLGGRNPYATARSKLQLSKNKDIRNMQIQHERDMERKLYGHPRRDYRKPDQPRYNPNADPKVQQLAETHGRHMQHLQDRNRDLERQREEIRRRLEELGKRPLKDDDSMNALLQELRDQEARNQKMLEELRRQLLEARYVPPGDTKKHPFIYPVYYGNSLVAEITAMRQAYLQNGGNDPDILHQLAQMQAEAQAIDDSLRNRPQPSKSKRDPDSLHALELENERLQRQLSLLQEQNLAARHRRKGDREGRRRPSGDSGILIKENVVKRPLGLDTPEINVEPLDINEKELNKKKVEKPQKEFISPRRAWLNHFDPQKVKIDKDVGNTAFKVSGRLWDDDEEEEDVFIDSTKIKRATLLNEPTTDVVSNVPNKPPESHNVVTVRRIPYYKTLFAIGKPKKTEKDVEIERLDLLSVIQETSRNNTAGTGNGFNPGSQREGRVSENSNDRPLPQPRPQLVVEPTQTV